jgi:hypothetical protein
MKRKDIDLLERREFLRKGAAVIGAGALGLGGVGELLARTGRGQLPIATKAPASADVFRIAVIGDSVMWGQGLHDLQKFSTKVRHHLQNNLGGREVSLENRAHSGAVIGFADPATTDESWAARNVNGEFPTGFPTIAYQAAKQVTNPESVDLLLMDGGINDVGIGRIMDPSTTVDWLRNLIGVTMRDRLPGLLDVVVPRFPKATILIMNYFPVTSDESNVEAVTGLLGFFLGPIIGAQVYTDLRARQAERWRVFHDDSTAAMRQAAADANARFGTQRVRFVDSGFGPANAVGASSPWLYAPGEIDPVDYLRQAVCDSNEPDLIARQSCYRANTGHPNRFGAEAYAGAIIREISPLIPGWKAVPVPNTVSLRVVNNAVTSTSKTITVYASDAVSGAALNGTVTINNAQGATGARITFRRCYAEDAPAGKVLYAPCAGEVSVSGYPPAGFQA